MTALRRLLALAGWAVGFVGGWLLGAVLSLDARPHATGDVHCNRCGRAWVAVWPTGRVQPLRLECPGCGALVPAPGRP